MRSNLGSAHRLQESIPNRYWVKVSWVLICFFAILRLWKLGTPAEPIFDEVYYPKYAHQWLMGEYYYDVHPPLGKLMIAFGEYIVGDREGTNAWGWRLIPAITGILLIPLFFWTACLLFKNKQAGLIAALLASIDGMFLVYSRTGLTDLFLVFFGVLGTACVWAFRRRVQRNQSGVFWLIAGAIGSGLAMDIKWTGAAFPAVNGIFTVYTIWQFRHRMAAFRSMILAILCYLILVPLLYLLPFLALFPASVFTPSLVQWHQQALDFSLNLQATHPYASKWWSWPWLVHPVWFYYKLQDGTATGINGIGDPITWWAASLGVMLTLTYLFRWSFNRLPIIKSPTRGFQTLFPNQGSSIATSLIYLSVMWAVGYLPWIFIGRVAFLYHYMPSHAMALLMLAGWLGYWWVHRPQWHSIILQGMMLAVLFAFLFIPIWIGITMPEPLMRLWIWFPSWT